MSRTGRNSTPRNPKVLPLLTDWVNQLADFFPSPFVSIGFDETFQIEAGRRSLRRGRGPRPVRRSNSTTVARLFQNAARR